MCTVKMGYMYNSLHGAECMAFSLSGYSDESPSSINVDAVHCVSTGGTVGGKEGLISERGPRQNVEKHNTSLFKLFQPNCHISMIAIRENNEDFIEHYGVTADDVPSSTAGFASTVSYSILHKASGRLLPPNVRSNVQKPTKISSGVAASRHTAE